MKKILLFILLGLSLSYAHSETTTVPSKTNYKYEAPLQIENINVDIPVPKGVDENFFKEFMDIFKVCIPSCAPKILATEEKQKSMMCIANGLGFVLKSISCPEFSHTPKSQKFKDLKQCLLKKNFNISERGLFIVSRRNCSR
jgi:hypothetical protein